MEKLENNIIDLESRRKQNDKKAKEDLKKMLYGGQESEKNPDNVISFHESTRLRRLHIHHEKLHTSYDRLKHKYESSPDSSEELLQKADALDADLNHFLDDINVISHEISSERQDLIYERLKDPNMNIQRVGEIEKELGQKNKELGFIADMIREIRDMRFEMGKWRNNKP